MRNAIQAAGLVVLLLGLLLQTHLRIYPWYRRGCQWKGNPDVKILAFGDPQITGFSHFQTFRKRVDIYGNDKYLAQIASTVRHHLRPDYVAVVGDLISSQWVPDDEFDQRANRFTSIFPSHGLGQLINISGNHDIGYHGDFTHNRLERFERRFGALNYVVTQTPDYRIVAINSMSLDGPPYDDEAQLDTRKFIASLRGFKGSTVLLLHVPLFKPEGIDICTDGPNFEYYEEEYGSTLKQQNHLSEKSSKFLLNNIFKDGLGGIIVAGHDHEGCSAQYTLKDRRRDDNWQVSKPDNLTVESMSNSSGLLGFLHLSSPSPVLVKEFTVRSIMGEFGGNSGLISGKLNPNSRVMEFDYSLCRFHVQHIWWVAQVLTIIGLISVPLTLYL